MDGNTSKQSNAAVAEPTREEELEALREKDTAEDTAEEFPMVPFATRNPTKQGVEQLFDEALQAAIDIGNAISSDKSRYAELKSKLTILHREQQITGLENNLKRLRQNWAAYVKASHSRRDCMTEHAVREEIHAKRRALVTKKARVQAIEAGKPAALGDLLTEMQALEDSLGNMATLHDKFTTKTAAGIVDAIKLFDGENWWAGW